MLFFKRFKRLTVPGWVDDLIGMAETTVHLSIGAVCGLIAANDTPELIQKVQQIGVNPLLSISFALLLLVMIIRVGTTPVKEVR